MRRRLQSILSINTAPGSDDDIFREEAFPATCNELVMFEFELATASPANVQILRSMK